MSFLVSTLSKCIRTCIVLSVPLCSFGVLATEPSDQQHVLQNNNNYPASFFGQYQPQNAMDMVERLPGFNFDGGDNARGFGGNAGNVLIDGARPTSKSGGLWGALQRIPAAQVERIEILRGGVGAGEAAGQSIVANVIKRKNVTSGTWALKFRGDENGSIKPNIEAAMTTNVGQWNGAFDIDLGQGPNSRTAQITEFDANNQIIEIAKERQAQLGRFAFSNAQLDRKFESGKLTLNGRVGTDTWSNDTKRDIFVTGEADALWDLTERNTFKTAELGIDWVETMGQWKWHSLGIAQVENREYRNHVQNLEQQNVTNTSDFTQHKRQFEYIVRNTYGYVGSEKFKPEYGIEFANNTLEAQLDYVDDGVVQELDNANVTVEELRAEIFASFVYDYSEIITLEGGLTAEFSQIEVSGGNAKKQNFDFLKPRVAANFKLSDSLNVTLEAQHVVGQLNFNDFAASSSVEDERDIGGNSDLVPEQVSQISAVMDWSFSEKGSVKFDIYHHWHQDILEEIVLPSGSPGLGNAGDSRMWGFNTNVSLPIDAVLENGLIEVDYRYRDTKFFDTIIGRDRITSYYLPHNLRVKFRQDISESKLAWGVEYYNHFTDSAFYVDELTTFSGNDRVSVFVETTYFSDLKIRLESDNVNTGEFNRTRTFFDGNRGGSYDGRQVSQRTHKPTFKLSIWGTF